MRYGLHFAPADERTNERSSSGTDLCVNFFHFAPNRLAIVFLRYFSQRFSPFSGLLFVVHFLLFGFWHPFFFRSTTTTLFRKSVTKTRINRDEKKVKEERKNCWKVNHAVVGCWLLASPWNHISFRRIKRIGNLLRQLYTQHASNTQHNFIYLPTSMAIDVASHQLRY